MQTCRHDHLSCHMLREKGVIHSYTEATHSFEIQYLTPSWTLKHLMQRSVPDYSEIVLGPSVMLCQ